MTPQEQLNAAVAKIHEAIDAAMEVANEHSLTFNLEVTYGAGATYYPPSVVERDSWLQDYHDIDVSTGGWLASSQSC